MVFDSIFKKSRILNCFERGPSRHLNRHLTTSGALENPLFKAKVFNCQAWRPKAKLLLDHKKGFWPKTWDSFQQIRTVHLTKQFWKCANFSGVVWVMGLSPFWNRNGRRRKSDKAERHISWIGPKVSHTRQEFFSGFYSDSTRRVTRCKFNPMGLDAAWRLQQTMVYVTTSDSGQMQCIRWSGLFKQTNAGAVK